MNDVGQEIVKAVTLSCGGVVIRLWLYVCTKTSVNTRVNLTYAVGFSFEDRCCMTPQ